MEQEVEEFAQEPELEEAYKAKCRELMSPADYQYRCEVALMLHLAGFTNRQIGGVIHTTGQRAGQIIGEAQRITAMVERVCAETIQRAEVARGKIL